MYDKQTEAFKMTGVCGIYCAECNCAKAKDDPNIIAYFASKGYPTEKLPCPGCRGVEGMCPVIGGVCETYQCAADKGVDFCFECMDFPCGKLNPAADRAEVLPHNQKVFNLCYIQNKGLDRFAEDAPGLWKKYFEGKMAIGKGPQED